MSHRDVNLLIFLPLINPLVKLVSSIFPEQAKPDADIPETFINIDHSMIEKTPSMAIMESEKKLVIMGDQVAENLKRLRQMSMLDVGQTAEICDEILKNEDVIDKYQFYITQFLLTVSSYSLTQRDAMIVGSYISLAHNLEKIADCAEHISIIIDKLIRKQVRFSESAINAINLILDENIEYFQESRRIFKIGKDPSYIRKASVKKNRIKKLIKDAKSEHFYRIKEKVCDSNASIQFIDILNNLNTLCSENFNIAEILSGKKYRTI